jgi:hypothetical protein
MTVEVIRVTPDELLDDRKRLLDELPYSVDDLRRRVRSEVATADERAALERLGEIAFLLGEDDT